MRFFKNLLLVVSLGMVAAMPASAQSPTDSAFNGAMFSPPGNGNGYIGCGIQSGTVQCVGSVDYDDESTPNWCTSTDPKMKRLLPGINKYSTVQFYFDAQHKCSHVDVTSGGWGGVTVRAGATASQPVLILQSSNGAWGTVSTAQLFPGQIRCTAYANTNNLGQVTCYARDHLGSEVLCTSTANSTRQTLDDQILATLSINESSYVNFTWTNTSPTKTCTSVNVFNSSLYLP